MQAGDRHALAGLSGTRAANKARWTVHVALTNAASGATREHIPGQPLMLVQ